MTELAIGTTLRGRYRLDAKIGAGGYGSVWAGVDLEGAWREPVAIKVLSERAIGSADARARFAREAEVLLSLEHPGIVRALDFFDGDDVIPAYLVLELVQGRTLASYIAARTRVGEQVPVADALQIFTAIAEAVAAAHAQGIIHRDLKPLNVMVTRAALGRSPIRVLDFGLAKLLHGDVVDATTLGRRLGSFLYMAPEQALAQGTAATTDIFALGTLLFELITLRRAWARDDLEQPLPAVDGPIPFKQVNNPADILSRIARGPRPRPSRCRPELPPEFDIALGRAMAIDPEARPATVQELLQDLTGALAAELPDHGAEPATDLADLPDILEVSGDAEQSYGVATTVPDGAPTHDPTPPLPEPDDAGGAVGQDDLLSPAGLATGEPRPAPDDIEQAAARLPVLEAPPPRTPTAAAPLEVAAVEVAAVEPRPFESPQAFTPTDDVDVPVPAPAPPAPRGVQPALLLVLLAVAAVGLVAVVGNRPPAPAPASNAPAEAPVAPVRPGVQARPASAEPEGPADPEPAPPPAPAARPEPPAKRTRSAATRRPAPAPPPETENEVARLRRRLAGLRRGPGDVEGLEALGTAIVRSARTLDDPARARRIERVVHSAVMVGDLDALADAIRQLEAN